jgi:hypothetical protein
MYAATPQSLQNGHLIATRRRAPVDPADMNR